MRARALLCAGACHRASASPLGDGPRGQQLSSSVLSNPSNLSIIDRCKVHSRNFLVALLVVTASEQQGVRALSTLEELSSIPAVKAILRVLDLEAQARSLIESPSSEQLKKALRAPTDSQVRTELTHTAGLAILLWVRHVEAHKFFITDDLPRAGLSSAVIGEVVQAALEVIVQDCSTLGFRFDDMGVLMRLVDDPTRGSPK